MRYLLYNSGDANCFVTAPETEESTNLINSLTESGLRLGPYDTTIRLLVDEAELRQYWHAASEHNAARKAKRASGLLNNETSKNPEAVIVKIEGLSSEANWQQIKSALQEIGRVVYLNYERGSPMCFARFGSPEDASAVADAASGPDALTICGDTVEASVLEGEEEDEYWRRAEEMQRERRNKVRDDYSSDRTV